MAHPKLSIIIPTWNTAQITLKCVKTIKKHLSDINPQIVVVDNASSDNTIKLLKPLKITLIKNSQNLGFAKACNIGARKAVGNYILFLNSDMELLDSSLVEMLEFLQKNPQIGAIGPKFLNPNKKPQASTFPPQTPINAFKEFWLNKRTYSKYIPKSKKPISVWAISGGAFLISKKLFRQVGGWDKKYFMYFEDLDLCRQIHQLNKKTFYYPACRLIHRHGASGKKLADSKNQWRRLIPSSKKYHGLINHHLINLIIKTGQKFNKTKIKHVLLTALLLRLILLPLTYHGDIKVLYWWGKYIVDWGPRGYYDWLYFGGYGEPDQPMLMIFYTRYIRHLYLFIYNILWFINIKIRLFPSAIMTWYFHHGNQVLLKLPMVFADLGIITIVYRLIKKHFSSSQAKFSVAAIALFPPLLYNSAIWGSGDAIINFLALLSLQKLLDKKYIACSILLISSILFKASLLIWLPIFLIIFLKNKPTVGKIFKITLPGLFLIYILSRPFAPIEIHPLVWFYQTFTQKILPGCMHQLTSNAMNLWALIFGLKPQLDELRILPFLTTRSLSLIIVSFCYLLVIHRLYRNYSLKNVLLSLVNISLFTFTFMTRMHERYTFPALIPLFILCFYNSKFVKYFLVLTLTHMLNIYNWWWWPPIPFLISFLKIPITIRIISLINLILTIKLLSIPYENSKN